MCLRSFCQLSVSVGVCTGVGRHTCICAYLYEPTPCSLRHRVSQINQSSLGLLQGSCLPSKHWNHMWITNCQGLHSELQSKVLYQLSHLPSLKC